MQGWKKPRFFEKKVFFRFLGFLGFWVFKGFLKGF